MPKKDFDWENGVILEDHTRKKHAILRSYFYEYLITRCQNRRQECFRLAVVDGFAGGGLYNCGTPGSPIIFLQCLMEAISAVNTQRLSEGFNPIRINCLLLLNELDRSGLELLKANLAPYVERAKDYAGLQITLEFFRQTFESAYSQIKDRIQAEKITSTFFNLDQSGYSQATEEHVRDIMCSWKRPEVILTFMISSLLAYVSQDASKSHVPLDSAVRQSVAAVIRDETLLARGEWLGLMEKVVFDNLKGCAPYVSPFSIGNPSGWRYWLMHFANIPRARQVYNDVLHMDGNAQGHYGRSGLRMLAYDPNESSGQLYLFDQTARAQAKEDLREDIPRLIAEKGNAMTVQQFYETAYSETPAHSDDIHQSIIENPDIQVITPNGGQRREARAIKAADTIRLNAQKRLIFTY